MEKEVERPLIGRGLYLVGHLGSIEVSGHSPAHPSIRRSGQLILPGGEAIPETANADWDQGNFVASLYAAIRSQLKIEVPWVSYIGDFAEAEGLCRVYGYDLNQLGFPVEYDNAVWKTNREVEAQSNNLKWGYEPAAINLWLDPSITRGKALTQAQCRTNQYAF